MNSRIGDVLQHLKDEVPDTPAVILTNSTMLSQKLVRDEIKQASINNPSTFFSCPLG